VAAIEDYALIGDLQTAALVGRDGSIDWLCFPRFDSGACFAALLGTPDHGRWVIEPRDAVVACRRSYRGMSLVLETELETETGVVRLVDFMPPRGEDPDVVRIVEGVRGHVDLHSELVIRFDYGSVVPWVRRVDGDTRLAVAGPDALCIESPCPMRGENLRTVADFTVSAGERMPFVLTWFPAHKRTPARVDPFRALDETEAFWRKWVEGCTVADDFGEAVTRSLVVLKALTYAPTGGIVAAPTTSLPELPGGVRNWDYRFCWLRDAALTLQALIGAAQVDEAKRWRAWLLRAVAGNPGDIQILYGIAGERRIAEEELDWLPGYEGSTPVRRGNAASEQLQLDVFGEVIDALYLGRAAGMPATRDSWALQRKLLQRLETIWQEPDQGIWEVRGPRRHFTHSKVMAWVAFDRAVRSVEEQGLAGPVDRWRSVRDEIHAQVCERGWSEEGRSFVQFYGGGVLDASLLMIPIVGFLPPEDARVRGTLAAVERDLLRDGFVQRYPVDPALEEVDGLPPGEGVFLPCSFWLVENLALTGRLDEATALFERLLAVRNDVGLLAEEYDPASGRLLGNMPQAFSHLALINAAECLVRVRKGGRHEHAA
jgi:GH15 family glucan-1,4-alpha-glucosidase